MKRAKQKQPAKQKKAKRAALLAAGKAELKGRLMARLLPPRPVRLSLNERLDNFTAGKPDPEKEWTERCEKIEREIDESLSPQVPLFIEDTTRPKKPEIPDQVMDFEEVLREIYDDPDIGISEALVALVGSNVELEPETRDYISSVLTHFYYYNYPRKTDPNYGRRKFALSFIRVKALLQKAGLKPGEAEKEIADCFKCLNISLGGLRQRVKRAPKSAA